MEGQRAADPGEGVDRRTLLKAIVAGGIVGAGAALAAATQVDLPELPVPKEQPETFIYTAIEQADPYGFDALEGEEARVGDFPEIWMGARTLWRTVRDGAGTPIPGTGFPALLIRVDPGLLQAPVEWVAGEDFLADPTIVAFFDRCTHLCCFPMWHTDTLPAALQEYEPGRKPRTFLALEDPIWCLCHNGQFDPVTLEWDLHPNGVRYVGARWAHEPVTRALPAISIREQGGLIVGGNWLSAPPRAPVGLGGRDAESFRDWYIAYCR